jgi:hypothetical protein
VKPTGRRFQEFLASLVIDEEVPKGRRLEKLHFERATARHRRRRTVKKILLGCVLAASVGIIASDVVTSGPGPTRNTPLPDGRSKSDNTPTSAGQAGSIESSRAGAVTAHDLVALPNGSEPETTAIPARPGAGNLGSSSSVEKPIKSPPVKVLSEREGKTAADKAVLKRPEKDASPAPQGRSPVLGGDARWQPGDSPDPAEIIDWLLKEYSPTE